MNAMQKHLAALDKLNLDFQKRAHGLVGLRIHVRRKSPPKRWWQFWWKEYTSHPFAIRKSPYVPRERIQLQALSETLGMSGYTLYRVDAMLGFGFEYDEILLGLTKACEEIERKTPFFVEQLALGQAVAEIEAVEAVRQRFQRQSQ